MESHEVLREAFKQCSPKEVAAELGLSLSLVYKWAQPGDGKGSGVENPLDRVAELIRLTRHPAIIQWLCQQAGGFFVKNPTAKSHSNQGVFPATNSIVQQFADLLESITKSAADNAISTEEAEKIRKEWDELKGFTEEFVRACEVGDFDRLKKG
jgi:hypothetical protein